MSKKATLLARVLVGLWALAIPNGDCVKIVSHDVPAAVEAGSDDIVLDCDFEYTEEEKLQLDIKWYFNDDPSPIYQWVPGFTIRPHAISDLFKEHINLDYQVGEDEVEKHRALHLKNPVPSLSGTYMCKVSSFIDEVTEKKDLLIYAPPSSLTLDVVHSDWSDSSHLSEPGSGSSEIFAPESEVPDYSDPGSGDGDSLNVTCTATGMYPLPDTSLTWGQNPEARDAAQQLNFRSDGLTDVSVFSTIGWEEMDQILPITCTISLPGTHFSRQEQTIYYPPGMEPTAPPDPETLLELESQGFIDHTFVDDFSGEGSGSGGWDPLCLESGSGVCLEDSPPPALYDPVCDESGSGVCEEVSVQDPLCDESGSGVCEEVPVQDPLCDESGSGVCEEASGGVNPDPSCEGSGSGECVEGSAGERLEEDVPEEAQKKSEDEHEEEEEESKDNSEEEEEEEETKENADKDGEEEEAKEEDVETVMKEGSDTDEEEEPTYGSSAYLSKSNSVILTLALFSLSQH